MASLNKVETRVGLFALATLLIIAGITVKVSDRALFHANQYELEIVMESAVGINDKTPVEIAGIQVGGVKSIKLEDSRRARITISLDDQVKLPPGTEAALKSKGFLGDTYIELIPGPPSEVQIKSGEALGYGGGAGDINTVISEFGAVARDVKEITASLKTFIANDPNAPFYRIMQNMDHFAKVLNELATRNERNVDVIAENMAELSQSINDLVRKGRQDIEASIDHIESITRKVDNGEGTIGKLVNDPQTVDKLNGAIDNLNSVLGGLSKLETEIGFHTEFLGTSDEFKHYVHLNLQPRPDERFMLEFVTDPSPSPNRVNRITEITAGGATSKVETESIVRDRNAFKVSAQIAKDFYDFTVRGGVVESSGGVGVDYGQGPMGVQFSAFNFSTHANEKAHLKLMGNLNLTQNLYLLGGADDMLNPTQKTDWLVGAGFRLVDDDVKSLLGFGGGSFLKK